MHSFFKYCIAPNEFHNVQTAKQFLRVLKKQSNDDAAIIPYRESPSLDDDEAVIALKAPRYFGAAGEAFAEVFFDLFGTEFNIGNVKFVDDAEHEEDDRGVDAYASSMKRKTYKQGITKESQPGSPVYIQVKTALNTIKEHMTNDGSRIMNFYGNAQSNARKVHAAYTARYVLFTFAGGIHWKLKQNTDEDIEVINFKKIAKLVDNNPFFWNEFYKRLGLATKAIDVPVDADAPLHLETV
jgi:hypothetical protein